MTFSTKISDDLFLVRKDLNTEAASTPAAGPVNTVFAVDCSGSMRYDLPKICQQLKNKLPKLLGENDTISIIWFSGRGQFGTLLEGQKVAGLVDLQQVNGAIDRWLKPVFLTGFKDPLEETARLIDRVGQQNPGAFSLIFLSDGHDNQWQRSEVLAAVDEAAGGLSAATFVEYGFYADRPLMTAMAERAGGQLIFSEGFDSYEAVFEQAITKSIVGGKRVEVELPNADFIGGIAFSLQGDSDLVAYGVNNGKVSVPDGLEGIYFLSPAPVGKELDRDMQDISKEAWGTPAASGLVSAAELDATYAAISLFAVRMRPEVVKPLLRATGDVALIEQFANCFGKQAYSTFMDVAKQAAFKSEVRFANGWDPTKVPRDDAFTVIGMLELLSGDEENRILFDHKDFSYSAIGRSTVDSNTVLTKEEEAEVLTLKEQLSATKKVDEITQITARITEVCDKPKALVFAENEVAVAEGYSISSLTFNENRPNVSVLVEKEGTVDLLSRPGRPATVPESVLTKIYRNYTIIKDGMVNLQVLPMTVSAATRKTLEAMVIDGDIPVGTIKIEQIPHKGYPDVVTIDLGMLPVINAQMVESVSAEDLFTKQYKLLQEKGKQKVYNSYLKELSTGVVAGSEGWKSSFGEDGVEWLKEQGLTERGGFSPKVVQGDAEDFYYSKELAVKLKSLSSLPTVKKVKEGIAKKKLTASVALMSEAVEKVEARLTRVNGDAKGLAVLQEDLLEMKTEATAEARRLMFEMAQAKFSIIVGQTWPSDLASLDDNAMDLTVDGVDLHGTVELTQKEIKI